MTDMNYKHYKAQNSPLDFPNLSRPIDNDCFAMKTRINKLRKNYSFVHIYVYIDKVISKYNCFVFVFAYSPEVILL